MEYSIQQLAEQESTESIAVTSPSEEVKSLIRIEKSVGFSIGVSASFFSSLAGLPESHATTEATTRKNRPILVRCSLCIITLRV
jgi:hypothetical protein